MIKLILLGLGVAAVIEGLVLVLAPSRFEDVLEMITKLSIDQRRMIGIAAMGLGVFVVWLGTS